MSPVQRLIELLRSLAVPSQWPNLFQQLRPPGSEPDQTSDQLAKEAISYCAAKGLRGKDTEQTIYIAAQDLWRLATFGPNKFREVFILGGVQVHISDLERVLARIGEFHSPTTLAAVDKGKAKPSARRKAETFPNDPCDNELAASKLTPRDVCALSILRAKRGKGMTGQQLADALSKKKHFTSAPTIRRHVIPKLKKHGVANDRSRGGYYIDNERSAK